MSLIFNGTNQYLTLPVTSQLDLTQFTICGWVFASSVSNGQRVIFSSNSAEFSYNSPVALFLQNGILTAQITRARQVLWWMTPEAQTFTSPVSIAANEWTHLTFSFSNSTVKLYINGRLVLQTGYNFLPITGNINAAIGGVLTSASAAQAFFAGEIADLRIYGRALSDGEVLTAQQQLGC